VTFTAIVPGAYPGEAKRCRLQKLTHVPLAIAIFLVLMFLYYDDDDNGDNDVCRVSVFSVTPSKINSCSAAREAESLVEVSKQIF